MAYLYDDDKLTTQANAEGAPKADSGQTPLMGSSATDVGSAVSTAGVGKGGTGGWTNIQAYLNANKDNNSTSELMNSKVGGEFDKEEKSINDSYDSWKSGAHAPVDKLTGVRGGLSDYVDRAARTGDQTERQGIVDEMRGYLNNQYAAPQTYSWGGAGAQAQEYGRGLGDSNNILNQLYGQASGGQFSTGQRALQQNLDINNPNVEKSRQDLSARYSALQKMAGQKSTDSASALTGEQTAYGNQQTGLKGDLQNMADLYKQDKYADPGRYKAIMDFLGQDASDGSKGAKGDGSFKGGDTATREQMNIWLNGRYI